MLSATARATSPSRIAQICVKKMLLAPPPTGAVVL
jgi:hypothetical protein